MKHASKLCAAFLALSILPASVGADPSGFELTGGGAYFGFDGPDTGLDDATGVRVGIGYRFQSAWGVEIAHNSAFADVLGTSDDVDVEYVYIDALYHLNDGGVVQPYFAGGFGLLDSTDVPAFNGTGLDVGFGIKFWVTDHFVIRPDVHHAFIGELDEDFTVASLNFSWVFGGSDKSYSAPKAAPVATRTAVDSDKDGVIDSRDRCPATPAGAPVNASGCPLDSDRDGVFDYEDDCPSSPAGSTVDTKGCPPALAAPVSIELEVNFASNSDVVQAQYLSEIERVAKFLMEYPNTEVVIEGHTDTRGSAEYNKDLSQRRADSVAQILVDQYSVSTSRVSSVGFGEEQPIADESTRDGLLANRRVIAKFSNLPQ